MATRELEPRPADTVEAVAVRLQSDGKTPNNPALPALILHEALPADAGPNAVRALLEGNGWGGSWTYTVFPYHHYHDDAHEVLAVTGGWADLVIGGVHGRTIRVQAGDVLVLPAGTGHCRKADGDGFEVCGAYPRGQEHPNILRPEEADHDRSAERIAQLPLPQTDPIYGRDGPVTRHWRSQD
jgi:uncharacterized protein YjlB